MYGNTFTKLVLTSLESAPSSARCSLTPRAGGASTADHHARPGGSRYIFTSPGLAYRRRCPLSSNDCCHIEMSDFLEFFKQFQDHLAPTLDVYEQAVYLYVARHSLAENKAEVLIGFKSARKRMAFGIGKAGTAPSEGVIYDKLKSLEAKGCLKIVGSERAGTRVKIVPLQDIAGLLPLPESAVVPDLEEIDFFAVPENRKYIVEREGNKCFYCLAPLNINNYVIEHVLSRPQGTNSYRNVVAACRQCNNRKNSAQVEDFLRTLYREGLLSSEEVKTRVSHLERLRAGELRPEVPRCRLTKRSSGP